ncbi:protein phosphatase 2C domain-containing protein [Okeania sp. SIO1I7]|uniref:protein phosphatase 2C domain-containing protein n=1 Tax=Okeania sp. SIO1I7 TaxID=2607772 RepID=UPI0013FAF0B7|nr:protein phosphatase 2C domain-containing protein [Okeania sp. SIO1I7]NET30015.1 SpoIIE family protein phosphatase [Okeania sp. SIO1I7]
MISENTSLQIGQLSITVLENIGQRNNKIHYFKVRLDTEDSENHQIGMLRVGSATGLLQQELQLREVLGDYALVATLLAKTTVSDISEIVAASPPANDTVVETPVDGSVTSNLNSGASHTTLLQPNEELEIDALSTAETEIEVGTVETVVENTKDSELLSDGEPISFCEDAVEVVDSDSLNSSDESNNGDYLEEEYYPEVPLPGNEGEQLLLLTAFPNDQLTLSNWLKNVPSPLEALKLSAQICQFFCYLHQKKWCFIDLDPDLIEIGKPICCFDLTCAYPEATPLTSGLIGTYCAPELAFNPAPEEKSSTYTIGALLYHTLHGYPPTQELEYKKCSVPLFSQLLALSLSPILDERFSLIQLRDLLINAQNTLTTVHVSCEIASESTVGLSPQRLHNEDSYGITQNDSESSEMVVLAALADGMGGMAQGEVASSLAVKSVMHGLSEEVGNTRNSREQWLISLVEQANAVVSETVQNGGTTLSLVLLESTKMSIAHVGDSRIYLVRDREIRQLSEDHSLVALLVASGQISEAESREHPDRNVLTKSLGSKKRLSQGYVQTVTDIELQDGDVILLCSDGVWDLVSDQELMELFMPIMPPTVLQTAVNQAIKKVLKRGAPDNATLLALRCHITPVEVSFPKKSGL